MASPPSSQRKLDLAAPRPALRPTRRCGPFAKVLGQPPTRSPRRRGDRGRRRKAIPEPLRPTPWPSRRKTKLDGSRSPTTTARPLRIFEGPSWASVRGVAVAIGRPRPPRRSPPARPAVVFAGGRRCSRALRSVQRAPAAHRGGARRPRRRGGSSRPAGAAGGLVPAGRRRRGPVAARPQRHGLEIQTILTTVP